MLNFQGRVLLAFALLWKLAPAAHAAPACTADGICLEAELTGGGITLWATSSRPGSTTLSLDISTQNLSPPRPLPESFYLPGPGRIRILDENFLQAGQPWKFSYRFFAQAGMAGATPDSAYRYAIPFERGFSVRVSQGFHGAYSHTDEVNGYAVDFEVPENTPVFAAREGTVVAVVQNFLSGGPKEPPDNANVIKVEHSDHTVAEYAHLRQGGAAVSLGQKVSQGELLGYSGNTGQTNGPHLHFAVHVPTSGKSRKSIPILFSTGDDTETSLNEGKSYRRP